MWIILLVPEEGRVGIQIAAEKASQQHGLHMRDQPEGDAFFEIGMDDPFLLRCCQAVSTVLRTSSSIKTPPLPFWVNPSPVTCLRFTSESASQSAKTGRSSWREVAIFVRKRSAIWSRR
jgi:hypothetical protein